MSGGSGSAGWCKGIGPEKLLEKRRSAKRGQPAFPTPVLLQALLRQTWHDPSDIGVRDERDRINCRRIYSFGMDDLTPDATTISRLRCDCAAAGVAAKLFGQIGQQRDTQGLVRKQGALIDATLGEADAKRPSLSAEAAMSDGQASGGDLDAGLTRREQRSFFRFKAHIAVDQGTDLIRDSVLTGADIGDSLAGDGPIALFAKRATRALSMPIKPTACRQGVRCWLKPASVQGRCTAVIRGGDHHLGSRA